MPELALGQVLRDSDGLRFEIISIRKYNHNHDSRGRFTSGSGSEDEAQIPRHGTKKHQVYQTYLKHGRPAAIAQAKELGLAPGTAQSWTSHWKRMGTPGGAGGDTIPVASLTPRPSPPFANVIKVHGESAHRKQIIAATEAIPKAHQTLLAKRGVSVTMQDKVYSDNVRGYVQGRYRHDDPFYTGGGTTGEITVADRTDAFGAAIKLKDPAGTTTHELGHAVDHASGWSYSKKLSDYVVRDSKGMTKADMNWAEYYLSSDRERFAELYRAAYSPGKTAFGMEPDRAKRIFAKSIAKLQELTL